MRSDLPPTLIGGSWVVGSTSGEFTTHAPVTGEKLGSYGVSSWLDLDQALEEGMAAYREMELLGPDGWADFLEAFANGLAETADDVAAIANLETGLSIRPRLIESEIPRAIDQVRQAAEASRARTWRDPVLNIEENIRRYRAPIPGTVVVLGPNNFPVAFNGIGGGDFAAAIGSGHPVLAKANPGHPGTTKMLAEIAFRASISSGSPPAIVQMVYDVRPDDGFRLVADERVAATAFTGSKAAGLALKSAADSAGRPIYLEMSSPNPVVLLPGVLEARGREVASELAESLMLASGQFCTKPGLLFVPTESSSAFEEDLVTALGEKAPSVLMGDSVLNQLRTSVEHLMAAGAELRHQSEDVAAGCGFPTTVLKVTARRFLSHSDQFREEAFGNVAVLVEWGNLAELTACLERLPGCLVGSIYCAEGPEDDSHIAEVLPVLLEKVGRLAENKATTGVAVVASMNHGGPFPASGHPGFTSVGIPETFNRFTMLQTFDNVRDEHLPPELQQSNPLGIDRVEIPPR